MANRSAARMQLADDDDNDDDDDDDDDDNNNDINCCDVGVMLDVECQKLNVLIAQTKFPVEMFLSETVADLT